MTAPTPDGKGQTVGPGSGPPTRIHSGYAYRPHRDPVLMLEVFEKMRAKDPSVLPVFEACSEAIHTLWDIMQGEPEHLFAQQFPSVGDPQAFRARMINAYEGFHRAYVVNNPSALELAYLRLYALWTFPAADQLDKIADLPGYAGAHKKTPEILRSLPLAWRGKDLARTPANQLHRHTIDQAFLLAYANLYEAQEGKRHGWKACAATECGITPAQINLRLRK